MNKWRMIWQIIKSAVGEIIKVLVVKPVKDIPDLVCPDPWFRLEMRAWGRPSETLGGMMGLLRVLKDNRIDMPSARTEEAL